MSAPPADMVRFTVDLPKDLHLDFKLACTKRQEPMRIVLEKFVTQYVKLANKKDNTQ